MPSGHYQHKRIDAYARLMRRVSPDPCGCWVWTGFTDRGQGQMRVGSKTDGTRRLEHVHRVAWEHHHGSIPDGLCVCHHCDVPNCVNPKHLFLGSQAENLIDMRNKGRGRHEHLLAHTKLSLADVAAIRLSSDSGLVLARRYGVSRNYIYDVRAGRHRRP